MDLFECEKIDLNRKMVILHIPTSQGKGINLNMCYELNQSKCLRDICHMDRISTIIDALSDPSELQGRLP